jgi:hypothetical protein
MGERQFEATWVLYLIGLRLFSSNGTSSDTGADSLQQSKCCVENKGKKMLDNTKTADL